MQKSAVGQPFDDIRDLMARLPAADERAVAAVRERDRQLTKPPGSLGRLEEIAEWLAAWQGRSPPAVTRPLAAVFAANHGVVARGVSAFPQEVTRQMVDNFAAGGAAVNQICAANDVGLKVFELALDLPSADITVEPALSEVDCASAIAFGMEAISGGTDLLCIGEMGIGNTTVAAAVACGLFGGDPAGWVGPGTGVDAAGLARKVEAVTRAVALNDGQLTDPLEILRRLGGRDIAAMAGAIIAARFERIPVLIDGYVATAAAAVLHVLETTALDHCLVAHRSAEPAHGRLLGHIGKRPLLDLDMRLGEASGAALAVALVRTAAAVHAGMTTFGEAGVSNKQAD